MRHLFWYGFGWACDFGMDRAGWNPEDFHVSEWQVFPQELKEDLKPEMCEICWKIQERDIEDWMRPNDWVKE